MAEIHQLLGVALSTSEEGMKAAYRRMAFKLHPDTGGATANEERFKELSVAWARRPKAGAARVMTAESLAAYYAQFDQRGPVYNKNGNVRKTRKDPDSATFY